MRLRLIEGTVAIVVVCLAIFGVPLALLGRNQVWASAHQKLEAQAVGVATDIEERSDQSGSIDLTRYADSLPGRRIMLRQTPGRAVIAAGPVLRGRTISASTHIGEMLLTVETSASRTATRVDQVTLIVTGLGIATTIAAVFLALSLARRLSEPIARLADQAPDLPGAKQNPGRRRSGSTHTPSGIPEIDRVADTLDRTNRQVGALIELQHTFASDAAHQLRTPLTSIALHLEEFGRSAHPEQQAEAEAALAQVERLNSVIGSLLKRARGDSEQPSILELKKALPGMALPWIRVLKNIDRELTVTVPEALTVRVRQEHLLAILGCLLDNTVAHGAGQVRLAATTSGDNARIEVTDEGPGVDSMIAPRMFDRRVSGADGTGIGLALARSLAEAEQGTLSWSPAHPARFFLELPLISPDLL